MHRKLGRRTKGPIRDRLERGHEPEKKVDKHKQTHRDLKRTGDRFTHLADLLPQIVFETHRGGNLTYANSHGFKVSGHSCPRQITGLAESAVNTD
jgi:hypothetical protein